MTRMQHIVERNRRIYFITEKQLHERPNEYRVIATYDDTRQLKPLPHKYESKLNNLGNNSIQPFYWLSRILFDPEGPKDEDGENEQNFITVLTKDSIFLIGATITKNKQLQTINCKQLRYYLGCPISSNFLQLPTSYSSVFRELVNLPSGLCI